MIASNNEDTKQMTDNSLPPSLPLIITTEELERHLGDENLLIVAVCQEAVFLQQHIPGSILIKPSELVGGVKPSTGKLPDETRLNELFSRIGLSDERHLIVYDDEGGGWAGRLIWTLDVIGHKSYSYLDGGLIAWLKSGLPLETGTPVSAPSNYQVTVDKGLIASLDEVLTQIDDPHSVVWDARAPEEYLGTKVTALRNGHIPGAINLDWLELMDRDNDLRLLPLEDIRHTTESLGITANKKVITHCHTHHRSGLSYLVGKALGLNIIAYDGSWSEWGNHADTPIDSITSGSTGL